MRWNANAQKRRHTPNRIPGPWQPNGSVEGLRAPQQKHAGKRSLGTAPYRLSR